MKAVVEREDGGHILFSHRDKVTRACMDPGAFVGPRIQTSEGLYEHMDHWRARAAIEAMMQLACESPGFARAIEHRRAAPPDPDTASTYLRWLDSPASDVNDAAVRAEDALRRIEWRRDHPKEQTT